MNENRFYDPNNTEFNISAEEFVLVQKDTKIKDKKLETKPTTFAKDAFKRFCKNKSSVVAACIIGFLLLCSLVLPLVIPFDISKQSPAQSLLPPKVFNAGTGWWDGTKVYENRTIAEWIPIEDSTEMKPVPAEFNATSVIDWYDVKREEYSNVYKPAATNGYIQLEAKMAKSGKAYFRNFVAFNVDLSKEYTFKYTIGDPYKLAKEASGAIPGEKLKPTSYDVYVTYNNDAVKIPVKTSSNEYGEQTINLTQVLTEKDLTDIVENVRVRFEIPRSDSNKNYILIKNAIFECSDEEINEELLTYSMTDANYNIPLGKYDDGTYPTNYWQAGNAYKNIYAAEIMTATVVIDIYEQKLGFKENFTLGKSEMEKYVANGWCEYTFGDPSSFKVLDEKKCPVKAVYSEEYNETLDATTLSTDVIYYKYLGFDNMPKYALGTLQDGRELIKVSAVCLRLSFAVAVVIAAINLTIGICWGSISGYFGGTVDLLMERFCEIISGVPSIIILTLALLLMGQNIVTFAIAMCLTGWIGIAGRTRTQFYRFKGREYVLASRTLGAGDFRLIFKHILPNAVGTIVTSAVLVVPSVIFSEATLSYMGLGLSAGDSFGVLLSKNQQYLGSYPALILFPSVIISLLLISFNLFGNGLRDALNPSLKGSE